MLFRSTIKELLERYKFADDECNYLVDLLNFLQAKLKIYKLHGMYERIINLRQLNHRKTKKQLKHHTSSRFTKKSISS